MEEIVRKLVTKHWNAHWGDSRTIEGEVWWIMKFADEIVQEWLRKFNKEVEMPEQEEK